MGRARHDADERHWRVLRCRESIVLPQLPAHGGHVDADVRQPGGIVDGDHTSRDGRRGNHGRRGSPPDRPLGAAVSLQAPARKRRQTVHQRIIRSCEVHQHHRARPTRYRRGHPHRRTQVHRPVHCSGLPADGQPLRQGNSRVHANQIQGCIRRL